MDQCVNLCTFGPCFDGCGLENPCGAIAEGCDGGIKSVGGACSGPLDSIGDLCGNGLDGCQDLLDGVCGAECCETLVNCGGCCDGVDSLGGVFEGCTGCLQNTCSPDNCGGIVTSVTEGCGGCVDQVTNCLAECDFAAAAAACIQQVGECVGVDIGGGGGGD